MPLSLLLQRSSNFCLISRIAECQNAGIKFWVMCVSSLIRRAAHNFYMENGPLSVRNSNFQGCLPYIFGTIHKCAIPARSFLILSWDRKVSRYFGIVLSLILNLENLGIDIGIVIEFRLLRYWYRYWYWNQKLLVLVLLSILKLLAPVLIKVF